MKITGFIIFISLFTLIYGGMHVYTYFKLRPFFLPHLWLLISLLALLGCSIFIAETLLHNNLGTSFAAPLLYMAFIWMGIVFMFFTFSVSIDLMSWIIAKAGIPQVHSYLVSPARTLIVGFTIVLIAIYGYFSALGVHIEYLTFKSPKIITPVKIVQISDLHLGLLSSRSYYQKVIDKINALHPDIIVSTGDLIDMEPNHLDELGKLMVRLQAKYGKYAVLGNHEAFAGIAESRKFTESIGFKLLSNTGVSIANVVNLVGVDDPAIEGRLNQSSVNESALLKQFDNGLYTILLKHQPVVAQNSRGLFDLQLSGHTHGGQIFPFSLLIHLFYKAPFGLSNQGDNRWLYVSRGTGTWGPPMRVLARPEITVIQLTNSYIR